MVKFKNKTMKNLFFLVLICTISKISLAQDYVPFPDTNAYWNINTSTWGSSEPTNPIGIIGDTVIQGNNYIKLAQSNDTTFNDINNTTYIGAYREENKRYYFFYPNDSTEKIAYDFNLQVGDTMHSHSEFFVNKIEVVSIDSILVQSSYRKRLNLHVKSIGSNSFGAFDEWIEGIGSTNGIIHNGYMMFDAASYLICFHQNNELVYIDSPDGACRYLILNLNELPGQAVTHVFPNPATNQVSIEYSGTPFESYSFEILDQLGRIVVSENQFKSAFKVNTNALPNGIYTYRFLGNSILLATGKLSVQ